MITQLGKEGELQLPRVTVDKETALLYSGLGNPYAYGKAMASFETARRVSSLSTEGTWKVE